MRSSPGIAAAVSTALASKKCPSDLGIDSRARAATRDSAHASRKTALSALPFANDRTATHEDDDPAHGARCGRWLKGGASRGRDGVAPAPAEVKFPRVLNAMDTDRAGSWRPARSDRAPARPRRTTSLGDGARTVRACRSGPPRG